MYATPEIPASLKAESILSVFPENPNTYSLRPMTEKVSFQIRVRPEVRREREYASRLRSLVNITTKAAVTTSKAGIKDQKRGESFFMKRRSVTRRNTEEITRAIREVLESDITST